MIKSIYNDQIDCIAAIMELYKIPRFDLDPCYGKGNFYKTIAEPKHCYDILPQFSFVKEGDARELPFAEKSLNSIIFDPPFLATKGPSLKSADDNNKILNRFSVFPTEAELFRFYFKSMCSFYTFLKPGGFLVFKCQDKVSSGKQYFSHVYICEMATDIGFYPRDLFILINENKMLGFWKDKVQKHAWKFHTYFWVFEKRQPKVRWRELLNVSC